MSYKLVEIERKISLGCTNPYIIKLSDQKRYVAKFPGNPDGTRVLINEYISAELAKILKLPIPNYKLIRIDNIDDYKDKLQGISLINGTIFCSEYIEKSTTLPGTYILNKVTNKYDSLKILIFDVIVGNNDRNQGNLLINFKNNTLMMIDHSHVFIYESLWDDKNLKSVINSKIDISNMNKFNFENLSSCINFSDYNKEITEYINVIKSITDSEITEIINNIPTDWIISDEEKLVLKEFILDRLHRIKEICKLLNIESGE